MHVIATAGHVDHGKSTLVRALTGTDPDRFAEEKRRGLTIELGYAWTTLTGADVPEDPVLSFVDVPGHERFIATMLAGLGPAPAVMFVVAADEGWRQQSAEHLAAVDALGLARGLLVVTRSDLADPAPVIADATDQLAQSSLGQVPAIAVSATTGEGLPQLRRALADLVRTMPRPKPDGRVRLWIDRSFTIRGAGTVITGTLGSGTLRVGDELQAGDRPVRIRSLQSLGQDHDQVGAVARVAVNLRGIDVADIGRGDALVTPAAWHESAVVDVRVTGRLAEDLPTGLVAHLGTAAVPVRLRPLGGAMVRLILARPLPVTPGDRLVLRDPGRHAVAAGAIVLDVDPPELRRRGAARQRAERLLGKEKATDAELLAEEVRRRGAVRRTQLELLGVPVDHRHGLVIIDDWFVDPETFQDWQKSLAAALDERAGTTPLDPRLTIEAARQRARVPDRKLLPEVADAAGLVIIDGRVQRPRPDSEQGADLGAAEPGLRRLAEQLEADPYAAPERPQLEAWGLGRRELAAAERAGRIVRLAEDIVLLPTGPALAMRTLAQMPQPFTTSAARQALGSTRRVIIPLLEHLDQRGWTIRVDASHRRVRK